MARSMILAVLAIPLWLAACATPPPATALRVPERFTQARPAPAAPSLQVRWWGVFEDPQLDALARATLDHNRDLRVAVERVERARALERASFSALLPSGGATATQVRAGVPAVDRVDGQPRVEQRVGAAVNASWEIDLFGRLHAASRASGLEAAASAADVAAFRAVLLADAATAYFAWQGVQAQIDALTGIVAGQATQLELARTRQALGATDDLDVRRAQSELRNTQARLAALEGEQVKLASRIALLSGRFPGELALAPSRDAGTPTAMPLSIGSPNFVLSQRPDVGAAEARFKAAVARHDAAWADLLPRLTLGGSLGVVAGRASDLSGEAARVWSVQPALAVPLFDLLRLVPLREAREAETRIALAAYENAVLGAVADVEASAGLHRTSVQRVRLLSERRDDAVRALDIAEARYAAGAIDQLALIDAQRTRRSAAMDLAAAIAEHRIAVVQLYRAVGATV